MVRTRGKYVEGLQERLQGTYRLTEGVRAEAVQIPDYWIHQANEDLIWI